MFVLIGAKSKLKKDLWAGESTCPNCGQVHNFHLQKLIISITIFFIPIFFFTAKRYLICDSCKWNKELSKKQYKETRKRQIQLLKNGGFPEDIIRQDFNPQELDIGLQIFKLVISAIFAIMGCLAIYPIIPFIISLKNLIYKSKCKKLYDSLYK